MRYKIPKTKLTSRAIYINYTKHLRPDDVLTLTGEELRDFLYIFYRDFHERTPEDFKKRYQDILFLE